jgi:hypothetical protein
MSRLQGGFVRSTPWVVSRVGLTQLSEAISIRCFLIAAPVRSKREKGPKLDKEGSAWFGRFCTRNGYKALLLTVQSRRMAND